MDESQDPRVGSVLLERYRIDALIGRGGMSTVYRGVQLSMKRPVALKLIDGSMARDSECVERFRREAEAMAQLRHPNTVRIYEFGVTERGELFIAMELLEGHDLAEHLRDYGTLSLHDALSIARQVLESLCEAHALGFVHRDLKPANVFLSLLPRGQVLAKVMDFGIAALEQSKSSTKITRNGTMMGTPAYMSPEQVLGQAIDARSDLYSLGITLFEMLVGQTPFEGRAMTATLMAHASVPPPRLSEVRPDYEFPGEVQAVLDRLLAKSPADRPASVEHALTLLESLATNEPNAPSPLPTALGSLHAPPRVSSAPPELGGETWASFSRHVPAPPPRWWPERWLQAAREHRLWSIGVPLLVIMMGSTALWSRPRQSSLKAMSVQPSTAAPSRDEPLRMVRILSAPSAAHVSVNGVELGITPYDLKFRGSTQLTIALPGYQSSSVLVSAKSEPNVAVALEALPAARAERVAATRSKVALPTAAALRAPAPQPTVAQRREAIWRTGTPYRNVAAAKRALQSGKLDDNAYRDVVWLLRTRRDQRADVIRLAYRRGSITRQEYVRRARILEDEYAGR
jgi:serine/threonine protein kinase